MPGEIPIVLTATVVPNCVAMSATDIEKRLREYKAALEFYQRKAPVFFLENSPYPLEQHADFRETDCVRVRRFKPSAHPELGKGFQEFEMLDSWISSEPHLPERWLKITGRYKILSIDSVLAECRSETGRELLIDQLARSSFARTYLFCVNTEFYKKNLMELYQQCDDRTRNWIERVLYRKLKEMPAKQVRFFRTQPRVEAVAGATGTPFPTGRFQWLMKQILRRANRLVDRRYLWYSK